VKPFPIAVAVVLAALLAWRWRRHGWEGRIVALAVIAGFAVYGSGRVAPPNLEHLIRQVGETLGTWTYLLVGVMAFLETGAFVGLVAPGESAVMVGGLVAGQGQIELFVLIAIVWAAAVAGDVTSYWMGKRLGRQFLLRHGRRLQITPARLEQVEGFFARNGGPTILIGRFIGLVRALAPFVAGTSRMPFRRFLPYDVIAAGLWSTTFCVLGYVFWKSFDRLLSFAKQGALAFGTAAALIVGVVVSYRWLRVAENRARLDSILDEWERRPLLRPFVRAARLAWERALVPAARRLERPARFAWERLTPGRLGLELTTLLAVGGVGLFGFVAYGVAIGEGRLPVGDRLAADVSSKLLTGWGFDLARAISTLGAVYVALPVAALAVVWLASRRHALEAWALGAGTALAFSLSPIAKEAFARARPEGALVDAAGYAYPSGHAVHSIAFVAVAVALRHAVPGLAAQAATIVVAVVVAAAIGLSRVYLDVHWLSDVLGGWGLSAAVYAGCAVVALIVAFMRQNRRAAA